MSRYRTSAEFLWTKRIFVLAHVHRIYYRMKGGLLRGRNHNMCHHKLTHNDQELLLTYISANLCRDSIGATWTELRRSMEARMVGTTEKQKRKFDLCEKEAILHHQMV